MSATNTPSSYPWDEPGEPGPGAEAEATAGSPDELPAAEEIFDPAPGPSADPGKDSHGVRQDRRAGGTA